MMDFAMMYDLEVAYDEYVEECKTQGIKEKSLNDWFEELE